MSPEIAEAKSEAPVTDIPKFSGRVFFEAKKVFDSLGTENPDFEEIKDLCCERPLSFPARPPLTEELTTEDQEDIKNARESLKEPGSTQLEDLEKELGL